jgi:hypothetical protein
MAFICLVILLWWYIEKIEIKGKRAYDLKLMKMLTHRGNITVVNTSYRLLKNFQHQKGLNSSKKFLNL